MFAAKIILRYVKTTLDLGLLFSNNKDCNKAMMIGHLDNDWSGDINDKKITSGYVFLFKDTTFSSSSKKQNIVALFTCEVEYVAIVGATYLDNALVINLEKHPVLHERNKHIETKYNFLREQVKLGRPEVLYCKSMNQIVDILAKPPKKCRFEKLRAMLSLLTIDDLD